MTENTPDIRRDPVGRVIWSEELIRFFVQEHQETKCMWRDLGRKYGVGDYTIGEKCRAYMRSHNLVRLTEKPIVLLVEERPKAPVTFCGCGEKEPCPEARSMQTVYQNYSKLGDWKAYAHYRQAYFAHIAGNGRLP